MNILSERLIKSINWSTVILFSLGFWLSISLVMDTVVIPGLWSTGMMQSNGFASASYVIFGTLNRIELLCSALVLSSILVFYFRHYWTEKQERWAILFGTILMVIATFYTYFLTPEMSGLGLSLNGIDSDFTMTSSMMIVHGLYWGLEMIKFVLGATLLRWCYRHDCNII